MKHLMIAAIAGSLVLAAVAPTRADPTTVTVTGKASEPDADFQAKLAKGITKLDDTHYTVTRALVDDLLANPMAIAKGARVVPAVKDGKPTGFKLYAIRPTSLYAKLGFGNGDTLVRINTFELTSADKALEIYTRLRDAKSLVVEIQRRGKPITLTYTIR